jgi:hypothetical protein
VSGTDGFLMRRRTSRAGKSIKDNYGFGANLEARASATGGRASLARLVELFDECRERRRDGRRERVILVP